MGKAMGGPWSCEFIYYGDSNRICAATLYGPDGSFATVENGSKWFYDRARQSNEDFKATVCLICRAPELFDVARKITHRKEG